MVRSWECGFICAYAGMLMVRERAYTGVCGLCVRAYVNGTCVGVLCRLCLLAMTLIVRVQACLWVYVIGVCTDVWVVSECVSVLIVFTRECGLYCVCARVSMSCTRGGLDCACSFVYVWYYIICLFIS